MKSTHFLRLGISLCAMGVLLSIFQLLNNDFETIEYSYALTIIGILFIVVAILRVKYD